MTKKILAGGAVVVAVLLYVFFANRNTNSGLSDVAATQMPTTVPTSNTSAPSESTNPTASGSANPPSSVGTGSGSSSGSSGAASASAYKDGTYQGPAENAVYGTVQVEAVISGGKLADVKFLQEPDASGHTTDVSAMAVPALTQEALTAQSAQVDIVSGATQTSQAFQASLGAALEQAVSA